MTGRGGLPTLALRAAEDELEPLLREAQLAILKHPVAAQAVYAALVAEGRRHAATAEGQELRRRLAASGLARRVREAVDLATLHALEPDPEGPYPSDYADLLFAAASGGRPLMASLFRGRGG